MKFVTADFRGNIKLNKITTQKENKMKVCEEKEVHSRRCKLFNIQFLFNEKSINEKYLKNINEMI